MADAAISLNADHRPARPATPVKPAAINIPRGAAAGSHAAGHVAPHGAPSAARPGSSAAWSSDEDDLAVASPASTAYAASPASISRHARSPSEDTLFGGTDAPGSPGPLGAAPRLSPTPPGKDTRPEHTFFSLPEELRIRIFSHLRLADLMRAAQACKAFAKIALDGTLWSKIDCTARNHYKRINTAQLTGLIASAGGFLRIGNFWFVSPCVASAFRSALIIIADPAFRYPSPPPISGCLHLSSAAVHSLADNCPNLQFLDLRGCLTISSSSLCHLLSNCVQLASIDVRGLPSPTNHVLETMGIKCGKTLRRVCIGHCRNITGHGVKYLVQHAPSIVQLHIPGIAQVDDHLLAHIGRRLPRLRLLDVRGCAGITSHGVRALLDASAVACAAQGDREASRLTHLTLSGLPLLTDAALQAVGALCPELEQLEAAGCRLLTDVGVAALAAGCHALRNLDLEDCVGVGDAGVRSLAAGRCRATLERLCLSFCEEVTDGSLVALVRHCPRLRALDLDNCGRISDALLDEIARLRARARRAEQQGVPDLALPAAELETLEVYDCRGVSREACKMLERKGGMGVKSFYSSGILGGEDEEEAGSAAGNGGPGGQRRRGIRRTSCNIL
ncbi:hypothetical protein DFJ74DRAFT_767275 [Hyaloraphidium curvatum]|nr:hypothetical protein DFJ74DRAFT_767275 [Hyaloraphidium curvatum]